MLKSRYLQFLVLTESFWLSFSLSFQFISFFKRQANSTIEHQKCRGHEKVFCKLDLCFTKEKNCLKHFTFLEKSLRADKIALITNSCVYTGYLLNTNYRHSELFCCYPQCNAQVTNRYTPKAAISRSNIFSCQNWRCFKLFNHNIFFRSAQKTCAEEG